MSASYKIFQKDCLEWLYKYEGDAIHLTFIDPPFNQGKEYRYFNDTQPEEQYWGWLKEILSQIYKITDDGGAIYFMQREKNAEQVLRTLRETGWVFQNLIIWKKKTSAVPVGSKFSKHYQIIVFATKEEKPRIFNKLRIDYPIPPEYKFERTQGVFITDVWDDIRELTSGYFAGNEAIRGLNGDRMHTQQSPVALLLRIILSSTNPGDLVLDPFAGTGTTLIVTHQLERKSIGIEIDPAYVKIINNRLKYPRPPDNILKYYKYYRYTPGLKKIWPCDKLAVVEEGKLL